MNIAETDVNIMLEIKVLLLMSGNAEGRNISRTLELRCLEGWGGDKWV